MLARKADVNAAQGDGATALHWAVYHDDRPMLDLLLRAGAKVGVANDLGITPLYLAAASGNAGMVMALLAIDAWRNYAQRFPNDNDGVILAATSGAVNVRLGGEALKSAYATVGPQGFRSSGVELNTVR